jgi:acyl-coenzyme A thioesterase PaaI-like protein
MARLLVDGDSARQPDVRQFELADWIDTAPLEDLIGLEIKQASAGKAVLSVPFLVKLSNGGGVMHGGVLVALADTAVAMAIKSLLPQETVFASFRTGRSDLSGQG